jgi:hypothetical protein
VLGEDLPSAINLKRRQPARQGSDKKDAYTHADLQPAELLKLFHVRELVLLFVNLVLGLNHGKPLLDASSCGGCLRNGSLAQVRGWVTLEPPDGDGHACGIAQTRHLAIVLTMPQLSMGLARVLWGG